MMGCLLAVFGAALALVASAQPAAINRDSLVDKIKVDDLRRGAQQLQDFAYAYPNRNRQFGTPAHNDSINWIARTLEQTGYYDVWFEKLSQSLWSGSGNVSIDGAPENRSFIVTYSRGGVVTAPLAPVANLGCNATDFPATVSGNIALIARGSCDFAVKVAHAVDAGASGALIYNNNGTFPNWRLGGPVTIPVAGIQTQVGADILAAIRGGATVRATINVTITVNEVRDTYNLLAETKGGNHTNVLVVGAHSDSVGAGPGINDDGSGMIGILSTALGLTGFAVNNAVRFAWWTAEEVGLVGSSTYVERLNETQIKNIRAYLNFDMIASPNFIYGVYDGDGSSFGLVGPPGSDVIESFLESWFVHSNKPSVATEFSGRSDYGPFLEVGIPSGGLFTGAEEIKTAEWQKLFGGVAGVSLDENYHQAGDTVSNLNLEAFLLNAQGIAYAVGEYATGMQGIEKAQLDAKKGVVKARAAPDYKGIRQHACSAHVDDLI